MEETKLGITTTTIRRKNFSPRGTAPQHLQVWEWERSKEFSRHQIMCNPTTMSKNLMVLSISTRHQPCARVAVLHAWRRRGTSSALGGARR